MRFRPVNLSPLCLSLPAAACDVIEQHMRKRPETPPRQEAEARLLTPEAPSIAFPIANPPVPPQPLLPQVGSASVSPGPCFTLYPSPTHASLRPLRFPPQEEDEEEGEEAAAEPPRFQLSSLTPQERIDYSQLIDELGEPPLRPLV